MNDMTELKYISNNKKYLTFRRRYPKDVLHLVPDGSQYFIRGVGSDLSKSDSLRAYTNALADYEKEVTKLRNKKEKNMTK